MKKPIMMPSKSIKIIKLEPQRGWKRFCFRTFFHGERQVVFIAENRLVLRAVVAECAVNLRHFRDDNNVQYKNDDT